MSVESIRRDAEELAQYVGWVALVVVGIAVTYTFGLFLAAGGVHNFLHHFPEGSSHSRLTGIELAIVPLSAIAAAWLRPGADRIRALRETRSGPWLPLRMAATLAGLIAYLVWSWLLPQASFGPDGFGYARWAGTALAAALTIFWLPLFPRLTAILAGMIAGPTIFAGLGYLFFESFLTMAQEDCYESCGFGAFVYAFLALEIGFLLLIKTNAEWTNLYIVGSIASIIASFFFLPNAFDAILLLALLLGLLLSVAALALREDSRLQAHPLTCAVVSGALALGLAVLGASFEGGAFQPY